jgi:hypothetical protein
MSENESSFEKAGQLLSAKIIHLAQRGNQLNQAVVSLREKCYRRNKTTNCRSRGSAKISHFVEAFLWAEFWVLKSFTAFAEQCERDSKTKRNNRKQQTK